MATDVRMEVHHVSKRKSAGQIEARARARELQAEFDRMAERRVDIATQAIALQKDLENFDAETERQLSELLNRRNQRRAEKHARLGAVANEMLGTKVSRSEAAGRMGMTVAGMNAARKAFDDAKRARTEPATAVPASAVATPDSQTSADVAGAAPEAVAVPRQDSQPVPDQVTVADAPVPPAN